MVLANRARAGFPLVARFVPWVQSSGLDNLEDDPGENHDLAERHPDLLKRLILVSGTDRSPTPRAKLPLYDQQ